MKEEYIRQVEQNLPTELQKIIAEELNQIFDSAMKHGETTEQTIDRLGPAEKYAKKAQAKFKSTPDLSQIKKRRKTWAFLFYGIAILCFAAMIVVQLPPPIPDDVIGYDDGPTSIVVSSSLFRWLDVLLAAGCASLAAAVIQTIRVLRQPK